ncbi:MAG: ATP-binding protein [Anaerolineaceae bacterium]|jgi:two-component system NtrC family sensor kinase|nr:ATP-binding protein [Anaerolineaceae bacterium]
MAFHKQEHILAIISETDISFLLEPVLKSLGYQVVLCDDQKSAHKHLTTETPMLVIVAEKLNDGSGIDFARSFLQKLPLVPVILLAKENSPGLLKTCLNIGIHNTLAMPLTAEDIKTVVMGSINKARQTREWVLLEGKRATASLKEQVDELQTLTRLGQSINRSLNLNNVLTSVVDIAVDLTHAEEGSLLLLDEDTNELYIRASRNFQEEFVRTFRLPTEDTLAGTVLQSGQPMLIDENTPQKIKTSYLVYSLIYVPIQIGGQVIGILGVDNRSKSRAFNRRDVKLLSAIAEYAATAIENARLYTAAVLERNKLETLLTRIQDGVIVFDQQRKLMLVNQAAKSAFDLSGHLAGQIFQNVFTDPDLLQLAEDAENNRFNHAELTIKDGRVFNVQTTAIPDVGLAITMNDITYLKKMDEIKSDFVNAISHDLRSPLTAIMGYIDLIDRVGPLNKTQEEFIARVQTSTQSITSLVDDLLNLGKIESGFDGQNEKIYLNQLIHFIVDGFQYRIIEKRFNIVLDLPAEMPPIFANPSQLRQVIENLLDNAFKYTPPGGKIIIQAKVEQHQIILEVKDSGIGISPIDLPHVFDKFYRAGNVGGITGTGLGLAIVKSIIDNHHGRIWVESAPGEGTTVTVVFPVVEE